MSRRSEAQVEGGAAAQLPQFHGGSNGGLCRKRKGGAESSWGRREMDRTSARSSAGAGRTINQRSTSRSARDLRFAGSSRSAVRRAPPPAADTRAIDDTIEELQYLMGVLTPEHRASHLPSAPTLELPPDFPAARANSAGPSRLAIRPEEPRQRMLRRPRRSLKGWTAFLLVSAIVAGFCVGIGATSRPPVVEISTASSPPLPEKTRPGEVTSLPTGGPPSAEFIDRAISGPADQNALTATDSDFNPTRGGSEAGLPQTLPAGKSSMARGATSPIAGSSSVHEGSRASSSVARFEETKPDTARPLAAFTCYPSAPAVRQDHPDAWPAWTLRAPGHEGTRCWYAKTRAAAHDR
jgi:hypothetical protein